jgi:serine phosphatase RsbU (regulator of sigma subunit)
LVVFTDGVTDAVDADGARYTEQRLLDQLARPAGAAGDTLRRIQAEVQAHAGHATPFDDITLFVTHRQPG